MKRITPAHITSLQKNEVFVFGSNQHGDHAGGAAKYAKDNFGAIQGTARGLQGQSYAIDTMQGLDILPEQVATLISVAQSMRQLTFLVTEIGCGIAGYEAKDIAPIFKAATNEPNIYLPQPFVDEIELIEKFETRFGKIENGKYGGSLDLRSYGHALPASFTGCGGYLYLSSYGHALPASFTKGTYIGLWNKSIAFISNGSFILLPKVFNDEEGKLTGYKKIRRWGREAIVTLTIPADAKRCHHQGQRKCRAEFAKVEKIEVIGGADLSSVTNYTYKPNTVYTVGEMVYPDKYDGNTNNECSHGINFFLNKQEAIQY